METGSLIAFSFLLITALSSPVKVDVTTTLFHGEDLHIRLPSLGVEVTYKNTSDPRAPAVVLMRGGSAVSSRAKLNAHYSHLVINAVSKTDEGNYTVKDPETKLEVSRTKLVVRDCSNELKVIYGDNFHIPMLGLTSPITLEYKSMSQEANQAHSRSPQVLLTSTGKPTGVYQGRISVHDHYIALSAVTDADEGTYSIRDVKGTIQTRVCLKVIERQHFFTLPYGKRLKINLMLNSSLVYLYYTKENDPTTHLLLDKGEFTNARAELELEDRLSLEGSTVFLDEVKYTDAGLFTITDIQGFNMSMIHLQIEPYKLETLYVAIIALTGLLAFLLLVCLVSCLIKVKKRAKRAAALEKLAENAGKEDEGEAFRQVVKNITKLSEESKHSQADNTEKSQSTEVDIKGLEVSSKEVGVGNLETSDSGVGFNTALPLDTDTDAPDPTSESVAVTISAVPETKSSPPSAAESKPSPPPAIEIKSSPVAERKPSPTPEMKKTPDQPVEVKLDVSKPADVKLSPAPSPEPKAGLSPADPKPVPSPSPEPKPATPKATTPTPEIKSALTPPPETPKPTTPEPITNGTPEPGPDSKPSPDHADIIGGLAPKAAPPKTPEVELKASGAALEVSKDGAAAEDSTTTAT